MRSPNLGTTSRSGSSNKSGSTDIGPSSAPAITRTGGGGRRPETFDTLPRSPRLGQRDEAFGEAR